MIPKKLTTTYVLCPACGKLKSLHKKYTELQRYHENKKFCAKQMRLASKLYA